MKIGVLMICLNPHYWPYAKDAIEGARENFLTDHQVDFLLWSDMPDTTYGAKVFDTEPVRWPLPTLMRYHLFLREEEELKKYDYLFYCDVDMKFAGKIGNEILGEGLTAALHPMYALRKEYTFPYEQNPNSTAYIPQPKYYAGGFQGGKTDAFVKAMHSMKRAIDEDFDHNYMARWNDESHWNRYLYENPPSICLSPAYVYPDSLIDTYYKKVWGQDFQPKIITLTKKHTTTKEAGNHLSSLIQTL